jgi:hypothetical protein
MKIFEWFLSLFNIEIDRHKCKFEHTRDIYECKICKNAIIKLKGGKKT